MSLSAFIAIAIQQSHGIVGADSFLSAIRKEASKPKQFVAPSPANDKNDPDFEVAAKAKVFIAELSDYAKRSDSLAPREAAEQWLALIEEGRKIPHWAPHNGAPMKWAGCFKNVALVLPRPEAWPQIVAIVSKMPETAPNLALLMFFARLNGDDQELRRLCGRLEAVQAKIIYFATGDFLLPIRLGIDIRSGNIQGYLESVEKAPGSRIYRAAPVPDLVTLFGREKAADWIQRFRKSSEDKEGPFPGQKDAADGLRLPAGRVEQPHCPAFPTRAYRGGCL